MVSASHRLAPWLVVLTLIPMWSWATVQEQRERLPDAPESCATPLDGQWLAHVYYPHVSEWYRFTLDLTVNGEQVRGTLLSHYWHGTEDNADVPPCAGDSRYPASVVEPVSGRWDGSTLNINATSWNNGGPGCQPVRPGGYMLDNFSGPVDVDAQEWPSVLDADSPLWTAVPTLFRRVSCKEAAVAVDRDAVAPPPFAPPSRGCDWW